MASALKVPPMPDHDEIVYVRRAEGPIPELSVVALLADATTLEGDVVPAGSEGTVVATWAEGEAYEVEFTSPVGVATVKAEDLRLL